MKLQTQLFIGDPHQVEVDMNNWLDAKTPKVVRQTQSSHLDAKKEPCLIVVVMWQKI